jgi:hypothetical protein
MDALGGSYINMLEDKERDPMKDLAVKFRNFIMLNVNGYRINALEKLAGRLTLRINNGARYDHRFIISRGDKSGKLFMRFLSSTGAPKNIFSLLMSVTDWCNEHGIRFTMGLDDI